MITADHIAFDLLPTECKFLLLIAAMGANLKIGNTRLQSDQALASVIRGFWNDSGLAPIDLRNLSDISEKLCHWYKSTRTLQN